ncbi:MAG: hypothetical protein ACI9CD_000324 [Candidatus Deianiraeaceae bacterium]|jgi:hypothetical protein
MSYTSDLSDEKWGVKTLCSFIYYIYTSIFIKIAKYFSVEVVYFLAK